MPLIYSEGRVKAKRRLRKEIREQHDSCSERKTDIQIGPFPTKSDQGQFHCFLASFNDAPVDLLSTHFIGRERELSFIKNAYSVCERDVPTRCALWGIPGVGKTQLALQYSKIFLDNALVSAVFWIACSTTEKLYQGFSRLLVLAGHPDQDKMEQNVRIVAARRWLEQANGRGIHRWLLVLDKVDISTLEFLRQNLPRQSHQGQILITTCTEAVAQAICKVSGRMQSSLEVEPPILKDATQYFLDSVGIDERSLSNANRLEICALVQYLGCLPFAIEHASSFFNQSSQTIDAFTKLYRGDEKSQILGWQNPFSTYEASSISGMFMSHLCELKRSKPEVLGLLNILAFWDPDRIDVEIIRRGVLSLHSQVKYKSMRQWTQILPSLLHWIPYSWLNISSNSSIDSALSPRMNKSAQLPCDLDSLVELLSSEMQLQSAIQQLQMFSFIKRRSTRKAGAYCMHDLTQLWVQAALESEGTYSQCYNDAVSLAWGALQQIEDPALPENWHGFEGLISHILSLTKYSEYVTCPNPNLFTARKNTAMYWSNRGRYHEAREAFQQLLNLSIDTPGHANVEMIQLKLGLANVNWHLGKFEESISLYDEVQQILESQFDTDHPDVLYVIEMKAIVYRSQARYADACQMQRHILDIRSVSLGLGHLDTIRAIDNFGLTLHECAVANNEGHDKAEVLQKQALTLRQAQLGPDHIDTIWSSENLANNYRAQGRYLEALEIHEHSLRERRSQLGEDHPSTIYTRANLASTYSNLNRLDEAEVIWRQLIITNARQRDESHSQTLFAVEGLADVCLEQLRFQEAVELYHRAIIYGEHSLGERHPSVLRRMHKLANLYRDQKNFVMSIPLFKRLLERRRTEVRAGHPALLQTYNDAAALYVIMGNFTEAEQYYRVEIAGSIEEFGRLHAETRKRQMKLSEFLRHQDRVVEDNVLETVVTERVCPEQNLEDE
ncbi:TPR-like protein [Polychaeton citri CBS 116435]|uniref:TPR-like protein n=1 Tax=Polychaeton citri CBS 116435 TaxID=1314669 RepID=A0A9P4UTK0_9PEZI|nr:TPR-like protein [Polychaeton citri CBS 116435]